MSTHPDIARLERLEGLAHRLDTAFRIPGTRFRFGVDAALGVLPVVGDLAAAMPAAYIIYESHRMGASRNVLARQVVNLGFDTVVGSIPVLGTIFDATYKASRKNVTLLRRHVEDRVAAEARIVSGGAGTTASRPGAAPGGPTPKTPSTPASTRARR